MPAKEPHDLGTTGPSVRLDAEILANNFTRHFELEFANLVSKLPTDATTSEYFDTLLTAIVNVLHEAGIAGASSSVAETLQRLAVRSRPVANPRPWTEDMNARRVELIDKSIQQELTLEEALELGTLTASLRAKYDSEEFMPIEGMRKLHRQLLDRKNST